jgi:integrase
MELASRRFQTEPRRSGFQELRVHFVDLRLTAAILAVMQDEHPKIVSDMLGHSTVELMLDTYSHLSPAVHQQAAAAMDAILAG